MNRLSWRKNVTNVSTNLSICCSKITSMKAPKLRLSISPAGDHHRIVERPHACQWHGGCMADCGISVKRIHLINLWVCNKGDGFWNVVTSWTQCPPVFFFLFGVPGGFIGICRIVRWNRCFFRMVWNHRLSIISHIMVYDTLCTAWIKKGSRFSFIKIFWTQHQTRKTWASMMSDLNHNALLRSFFLGGVLLSCLRLHSTPRFFFCQPCRTGCKAPISESPMLLAPSFWRGHTSGGDLSNERTL